jgi:hypothetical protein
VTDPSSFSVPGASPRVTDDSRRLSGSAGARLQARWRPAERIEVVEELTHEQFSVHGGADTPFPWTENDRLFQTSTGVTWLSRASGVGVPLQADLTGLYRPLLERDQLRLDAWLLYRRDASNDTRADATLWRLQAAVGALSSLEASFSAGRYGVRGGLFDSSRASFGGGLRWRPAKQLEAYGTLTYHPLSSIARYPSFILNRGSLFRTYFDLTDASYDGAASLHVGVRLIF